MHCSSFKLLTLSVLSVSFVLSEQAPCTDGALNLNGALARLTSDPPTTSILTGGAFDVSMITTLLSVLTTNASSEVGSGEPPEPPWARALPCTSERREATHHRSAGLAQARHHR